MQRRPSHYNPYPSGSSRTPQGSGSGSGSRGNLGRLRGRIKLFQDSVLDTCRTLEGVLDDGTTLVEMSQRSELGPVAEDEHGAAESQARRPSPDEYEVQMERGGREGEVAAAGDAPVPADTSNEGAPRRWGTVSTARLSLDSLYQQDTVSSRSLTTADSRQEQRRSIEVSEPSPLTLNPVHPPPWGRDSPDVADNRRGTRQGR